MLPWAAAGCRRSANGQAGGSAAARSADPDEERAIDFAKNARTITPRMTNADYIRDHVSRVNGTATVVGWRAQRYDPNTYLVTFTYLVATPDGGGEIYPFPFEVRLPEGRVRYVLGDAVLSRKYGDKLLK